MGNLNQKMFAFFWQAMKPYKWCYVIVGKVKMYKEYKETNIISILSLNEVDSEIQQQYRSYFNKKGDLLWNKNDSIDDR